MSKWALTGFCSLFAVFCVFTYAPLIVLINEGLIAEPTNPAWIFLTDVFPIGWVLLAFLFVVLAVYSVLSDD